MSLQISYSQEQERLEALYKYQIMDTDAEKEFDDITQLISHICETPISLITLLDDKRQWFKSKVGLEIEETPRNIAFCDHSIRGYELFEVLDANDDDRFRENPLVIQEPRMRYYAGVPLTTPEGHNLGTLCVIDLKPRKLSSFQKYALQVMAKQVVIQLELKEKIRKMNAANIELELARNKAEQANLAKSQFLSMMSHEMRTPLNAVIGISNLLLNQNNSSEQLELLNTLKFSAENLQGLIDDVLDFNKIEAGKISIEVTKIDLYKLLKNLKESFLPISKNKGIALNFKIGQSIPTFVLGDKLRLYQILSNLLINAIKFTQKGEVSLKLESNLINQERTSIRFTVEDTGIGIPEDKLKIIFEAFEQANSDTTRKYGGSGLGLSIVKKLLLLQGSNINVKSKEGEGSSFYFDLEFKSLSEEDEESDDIEVENLKLKPDLRLLLVEDNYINVMVISRFLQNWKIEHDTVPNGKEAVAKVQENHYDVILMDLQMPEMDGFEATRRIRELGNKYKLMPIIALTASAMLDVKDNIYNSGMDDFVPKPFKPENLYSKIAYWSNK
jgi:signal transduction histidine kinase